MTKDEIIENLEHRIEDLKIENSHLLEQIIDLETRDV